MAVYQILVRNLDGRTQCLQFASSMVSCEDVKAELTVREGIPGGWQRLVAGTRELVSESHLVADVDGFFPSCTLLLRLRGGKGGFGSLLRGAATKAGQKKTSNFDACRDMSGRRLRHVNAEKKLKEWKSEAKERELEKTAEEFLKKQRKVEEEDSGVTEELEKYRKQSLEAREAMGSAVTDGLIEAMKIGVDLKRKKVQAVEAEVKRPRLHLPGMSESDNDWEDSDEDSEDDDEAGPYSSREQDNLPSASSTGPSSSGEEETLSAESSPSCSNEDKASPSCSNKSEACPSPSGEASKTSDLPERIDAGASSVEKSMGLGTSASVETTIEYPISSEELRPIPVQGRDIDASNPLPKSTDCSRPHESGHEASTTSSPNSSAGKSAEGHLNLDEYKSAEELEILGLERLKMELQKLGLKFGGSLSERAARLWLLKTIPFEKLDKKLLSKPPRKNGSK